MLEYWPIIAVAVFFAIMAVWSTLARRGARQTLESGLRRHGFFPCPEEQDSLLETVTRLENTRGFRYELRDPKRLHGSKGVYSYTIVRHDESPGDHLPIDDDEVLLPLKRSTAAGVVLVVKPSSLEHGMATRLIGNVATGNWDSQPVDLQRLELPADLQESNLLGALGPPGASLDDLIDRRTLSVLLGVGDAGALVVRCRDGLCAVASIGAHIPFDVGKVLERIRPLLM